MLGSGQEGQGGNVAHQYLSLHLIAIHPQRRAHALGDPDHERADTLSPDFDLQLASCRRPVWQTIRSTAKSVEIQSRFLKQSDQVGTQKGEGSHLSADSSEKPMSLHIMVARAWNRERHQKSAQALDSKPPLLCGKHPIVVERPYIGQNSQ